MLSTPWRARVSGWAPRAHGAGREAYQTGRGCTLALPEAVEGVAVVCCCSSVAAVDAWTVATWSAVVAAALRLMCWRGVGTDQEQGKGREEGKKE